MFFAIQIGYQHVDQLGGSTRAAIE
jgi:hypothetical protein